MGELGEFEVFYWSPVLAQLNISMLAFEFLFSLLFRIKQGSCVFP